MLRLAVILAVAISCAIGCDDGGGNIVIDPSTPGGFEELEAAAFSTGVLAMKYVLDPATGESVVVDEWLICCEEGRGLCACKRDPKSTQFHTEGCYFEEQGGGYVKLSCGKGLPFDSWGFESQTQWNCDAEAMTTGPLFVRTASLCEQSQ